MSASARVPVPSSRLFLRPVRLLQAAVTASRNTAARGCGASARENPRSDVTHVRVSPRRGEDAIYHIARGYAVDIILEERGAGFGETRRSGLNVSEISRLIYKDANL